MLISCALVLAQSNDITQTPTISDATNFKEIDFYTDEGTAMSVDSSPDGKSIVFDIVGSIYKIPMQGGKAVLLTADSGSSVNYHPRYSPNGKLIAFVSDRSGQHNLWIMDANGANPRPVVIDDETRFAHPVWTPDGRSIVVTRILKVPGIGMEKRDLRLWIYSVDTGSGRELVGDKVTQAAWPSVSPDGKYVFFDSSTFSTSPLAGMPHTQYHLERIALDNGNILKLTRPQSEFRPPSLSMYRMPEFAPPNSFSPELSPNGRFLAFARRIPSGQTEVSGHKFNFRTALWVRDLQTGEERVLVDPLDPDRTGTYARAVLRVMNGYSWLKDGSGLLVPINGKIRKVSFPSGAVETIPFQARVKRRRQAMATAKPDIAQDHYDAPFLQWLAPSPDGRKIVFYAGGQLWIKANSEQKPRVLTEMDKRIQLMPSWSADGKWIAFVTWEDSERGHIWKIRPNGGKPVRLTRQAGEYFYPAWSPDSKAIVVTLGSGETARGNSLAANLHWRLASIPAKGGQVLPITSSPGLSPASWGRDNRIYFLQRAGEIDELRTKIDSGNISTGSKVLASVNNRGNQIKAHAVLPNEVHAIALSPDRRRLALAIGYELYVTKLTDADGLNEISFTDSSSLPMLSHGGGWFPVWRDNHVLEYLNGKQHIIHDLGKNTVKTHIINLPLQRNFSNGLIAFTEATIISGELGDNPQKGTVLIKNGRIVCAGSCDTAGADKVINATGKFIMPGIVDVHDHPHSYSRAFTSRYHSPSALQLAYGVTTVVDPYAHPLLLPSLSDLTATGRVPGPRYLYTGIGIRGLGHSEKITSLDDAERIVAAHAAAGAIGIKQFHVTTRRESQLLSQATRNYGGLYLTAEQADIPYIIGLVLDGYSGWEHMLSYDTLYKDVTELLGQSGITYSPTAIVGGLSHWSSLYFIARDKPWLDPKFTRFIPWQRLTLYKLPGQRARSEFSFPFIAEGVARVVRAGGNAAIGAHGEVPGLGAHFEMQIYASAMSNKEVIHMATMGGANFIGAGQSIGSIKTGKIADLIVLNSNPLDNIKNTLDMQYVMTMGHLYDADTLNQVWPNTREYGPVPWISTFQLAPQFRPLNYWNLKQP